jgi:uncharacterized protein DUF1496
MIRYLAWILICIGCVGAAKAAPEPKAGTGPVCLYESKAYSDGAYLCVQKSLMLVCGSDSSHAMWKPVGDKDINERCTAPMTFRYPAGLRAHGYRRHAIFHRVRPLAAGSAKCFMFTGKQYCE